MKNANLKWDDSYPHESYLSNALGNWALIKRFPSIDGGFSGFTWEVYFNGVHNGWSPNLKEAKKTCLSMLRSKMFSFLSEVESLEETG